MKIALFANTSWNLWNFRMGLIKALQKAGHEVIAIAPTDDYSSKLTSLVSVYYPISIDGKGSNPINDLKIVKQQYSILKKSKPDVVLQFTIKPNIYGTLAAKMAGIPVINNVSGLGTVFLNKGLVAKTALLLYRLAFRFPAKVFFQNEDDRKLFIKKRLTRESLTAVLPGSGVNLAKFKPTQFHRNEPFEFLMIARLIRDKGVREYVEASKILKSKNIKAVFRLMGFTDFESPYGISKEELQNWVSEGYIQYEGTTDDTAAMLHKTDCVVLPSYREGTSKVLLEALASGKPIVTTDVPGCRETVIVGKNGFLCESGRPESLADQMEKLFDLDNATLESFGKVSRNLAESTYNEQLVFDLYLRAIKSLEKQV